MRLLIDYKVKMRTMLKGLGILGIVLLGLLVLFALETAFFGDVGEFSGVESIGSIYLFVTGIVFYSINVKMCFANGISRKTNFITTILCGVTVSIIMFIGFVILYIFFNLINSNSVSMFEQIYANYHFSNEFVMWIEKAFYDILNNLGSFIAGTFIGALYFRMSRPVKIAVSVGVPVLLFVVMPIFTTFLYMKDITKNFMDSAIQMMTNILTVPYKANLFNLVSIIIVSGLLYLLSRKAPIKANA